MTEKAVLREKSAYQKDDCLFCDNPSTLEVNWKTASIRCCENVECIKQALDLAQMPLGIGSS